MSKHIMIDPGHGGHDSGATGNGHYEKNITLEVSLAVRTRLKAHGFKVSMTREKDEYVGDASARGRLIGQSKADYGISIHVNSASSVATGAEVIAPIKEKYAYTECALKQYLSEIGPFRKVFSRDYHSGTNYNREIANRLFVTNYNKTDYYGVIREAWKYGVSTDIVELFFINNAEDVKRYTSQKNAYVEAIVHAICDAFDITYQPVKAEKPSTSTSTNHWYRVVVGSYGDKTSAEDVKKRLEGQGYTGVWLQTANVNGKTYTRVICGSYEERSNADQVKTKLEGKGYTGVWIDVVEK